MIDEHDPRLTAFALGELSEEESREVAQLVAELRHLSGEVEQIRQVAARLTTLLAGEPCPALGEAERAGILQAAEDSAEAQVTPAVAGAKVPTLKRRYPWPVYATLAALLVSVSLGVGISIYAYATSKPPVYRAVAWLRILDESYIVSPQPEPARQEPEREQPKPATIEPTRPPQGDGKVAFDGSSTLLITRQELHSRITSKEVEQELLKAQIKAYEEKLSEAEIEIEIDEEAVEKEAIADKGVQSLTEEAVAQRQLMGQILAASAKGVNDPHYQRVLQTNLETERKRNELLDSLRDKIRTKKHAEEQARRDEMLAQVKKRVASNQMEIDLLSQKFENYEEMKGTDRASLELAFKESELRREEQILESISNRISRLRTEYTVPTKVTLLRKADPPTEPIDNGFLARWSKQPEAAEEPPASESSPTFVDTQIQLIRNPLVLESVLARPDVAAHKPLAESPLPVQWLQERMRVHAKAGSELIVVEFECEDPQYAATITNAIVESYFRMHTQDKALRSTRVVELLEDERARRMVIIQQMRNQIKELKARTQDIHRDVRGVLLK